MCSDVFILRYYDESPMKVRGQRVHDAMIMPLLHQKDVATSFWRNNDVIIHWYWGYRKLAPVPVK